MPRSLARCLLVLVLAAGAGCPAGAAEIIGRAEASDGDTLAMGSLRIRLFGVDAPETGQTCATAAGGDWPCGAAAQARLAALVAGRDLSCTPQDRDRYGRIVAVCAAGGVDLGATLVEEGLARAYTEYSLAYADAEAAARGRGRGLWQGESTAPWDYRHAGFVAAAGTPPAGETAPAAPPDACPIKGNVAADGERVYHLPGSRWYERTRIDPEAGERWFCSEAEAESAGWRPAR